MVLPQTRQGEIWTVPFPGDPPGKGPRYVVIVSIDRRNTHPNAQTVLVIPLSTTLTDMPTHIRLQPGETGLREISELQAESISTVRKESLRSRPGLRTLSTATIRKLARAVILAMGLQPKDIAS